MNSHVRRTYAPDILSALSGGLNPYQEAKERASQKTGRQIAEIGDVNVTVTVSVEAIDNNWGRVVNRLEKEIDTPYPNETFYLQSIIEPCPAYDGWTVILEFDSVEDMSANLERFRRKIENIVNDKRR